MQFRSRQRWGRSRKGRERAAVRGALLATCVLLGASCSTTLTGQPEPEPALRSVDGVPGEISQSDPALPDPARSDRDPAERLLPIDRFPERYPAVVLPARAVSQASPDLTGIQPGSKVDPPGCLPPAQDYGPTGTAMAVGTAQDSRATISVEVTTNAAALADYRTYLGQCARVEATQRGVTAIVDTDPEIAPPSAVPDADTLAMVRTVRSGTGEEAVTQSMTTRIGQVGDVRVTVTYMSFDSVPPDIAELDRVFAEALRYAVQT